MKFVGINIVMLIVSLAVCHSAVIHVPADQPTVQAGLNTAAPGDIVLLAEGTFHENIVWPATPDITLRGDGLPGSVILDGNLAGRVVTIADEVSEPVRIESVTIQNGRAGERGGGVYAFGADVCMLDCIITQNGAPLGGGPGYECYGGGIFADGNTLILYNCTVSDNHLNYYAAMGDSNYGGGVYANELVAVNCIITDNTILGDHSYGGGMCVWNAHITNCLINGNSASFYGGMAHSQGFIRNSTVTGNENIDFGIFWTPELAVVMDSCVAGTVGFVSPQETHIEMNYTCFGSADPSVVIGPGSFSADPMFVTGPDGNYYLSNTAAGQAGTSPCVDTGNPTLTSSGTGSTRSDHVSDTGIIDMGCHYNYHAPAYTPTPVPTMTPTETAVPSSTLTPTQQPAEQVQIDLVLPAEVFHPGVAFYLNLEVDNNGPSLFNAQLFLALSIGSGDYWFYPNWVRYPQIDWMMVGIPAVSSDTWSILPEFSWPQGAGSFDGAMFLAAILHENDLVSNLADVTFGWSDEILPTQTPIPSPTPTFTPPPAPDGFVYIPPGIYTRGSPDTEPCRQINERPLNQVTLSHGLFMMDSEVSRGMWADLRALQPDLPDDPSDTGASPTLEHPVDKASWYEAILFANLKSLQEGFRRCYYRDAEFTVPIDSTNYTTEPFFCDFTAPGFRLPTDAEWEYAVRAGTTGPFFCEEPNYTEENCYGSTCIPGSLPTLELYAVTCANNPGGPDVVRSKLPNPWGLFDMHGNVWEWCWDWYAGSYPSEPMTDPEGPVSGYSRTMRGGGWGRHANDSRSARRQNNFPDDRHLSQGFRLVRMVF